MACEMRYAEAFDYAILWMCKSVLAGVDTAGAGLVLTDAAKNFTTERVEVGMPVYNPTSHTYGKITAVGTTTVDTTITWTLGDSYQIVKVATDEVAMIESYLQIAAADINAARAAVYGCDCTVSTALDMYMRKLNVIDAAIWHNCPCARPNLSDSMRQNMLFWVTEQLNAIADGTMELCQGYGGRNVPAIGFAQMAWTNWRAAEIIIDAYLRED